MLMKKTVLMMMSASGEDDGDNDKGDDFGNDCVDANDYGNGHVEVGHNLGQSDDDDDVYGDASTMFEWHAHNILRTIEGNPRTSTMEAEEEPEEDDGGGDEDSDVDHDNVVVGADYDTDVRRVTQAH